MQSSTMIPASGGEPELSNVCKNESDKVTLRNIVYTLWAVNKECSSSSASHPSQIIPANCYLVRNRLKTFKLFFWSGNALI